MYLSNDNIQVCIDEATGMTTEISNPTDSCSMNWIIQNAGWGEVDGFELCCVVCRMTQL